MDNNSFDFLILGQGFSGTALALTLEKPGLSYIIIADENQESASCKAVGLVNPVTGRRMAKTPDWDEILPVFLKFYAEAFELIFKKKGSFLEAKEINKALFSTEEINFLTAKSSGDSFKNLIDIVLFENRNFPPVFKGIKAWANIRKGGRLDPRFYLESSKSFFQKNNKYEAVEFNPKDLKKEESGWQYNGRYFKNVVSCLGMSCPWTKDIMFPNKGQVYETEGLPDWGPEILKTDIFLVPLGNGKTLIGSTYEREFEHLNPDEQGWKELIKDLEREYSSKLKIKKSWAGVRPTTSDRLFIVSKMDENLYCLNGMGAKGISMSPFAVQKLLKLISS